MGFSESLVEEVAKGTYRRMIGGQHPGFDQDGQARRGVDAQQCLSVEFSGLKHLTVRPEPCLGDGLQSGISRLHPPELHLLQKLDDGIGLRQGADGLLDGHTHS